jgi:TPP-dependent pyruvate/acetoin dehydrogenase alpha subunit
MGIALASHLGCSKFPKDALSYVSVGDGSVNNAHFLTAINLAEYARFRKFKCPTLFAITDNNLCISLKGSGWLQVSGFAANMMHWCNS